MKRAISTIIAVILCMGMLPSGALAADRQPVCKTVICYNTGDEPKLEVQYEDGDGNDLVELYLLGNKAKNGDMKGPPKRERTVYTDRSRAKQSPSDSRARRTQVRRTGEASPR